MLNTDRIKTRLRVVVIVLGVFVFYLFSVGLVPAFRRHAAEGQIDWLFSKPATFLILQIYEWPAQQLARLPGFRNILEFSSEFWCDVTGAPETTP
jgi:hypothetical protein